MKHNSIPPVSGFICDWSHLTAKTKLYLVKPYMRKSICTLTKSRRECKKYIELIKIAINRKDNFGLLDWWFRDSGNNMHCLDPEPGHITQFIINCCIQCPAGPNAPSLLHYNNVSTLIDDYIIIVQYFQLICVDRRWQSGDIDLITHHIADHF